RKTNSRVIHPNENPARAALRTSGAGNRVQFVSKATRLKLPSGLLTYQIRHPCCHITAALCSYTGTEMELSALIPVVSVHQSLKGGCPNDEDGFHRGGSRSGADDCSAHYSGQGPRRRCSARARSG